MKRSFDRKALFESVSIPSAVARLSIPMVLSALVSVLYNLADTYFVGKLADPVQNAAVTLVYPLMLAFNAVNNLFGVGSASMMSRCLGAGDRENVKNSSAFGFYGALFFSGLFSLSCTVFRFPLMHLLGASSDMMDATARYMFWTVCCGAVPAIVNSVVGQMVRSEGEAFHASLGSVCGCLLNVILDPFFILPWGLNMGAEGAGLATFISNLVACLYFAVYIRRKRGVTYICLDIRRLRRIPRAVIKSIMVVGVPAMIQNLLNVTGSTILTNFTASFGSAAIASMGIAHKLSMIPNQIAMGFAQGVMPLVGYNYASGNIRRMKKSVGFALSVVIPGMLLITTAACLGARPIVRSFMDNPEIIHYGSHFLRGMCIGMMFNCIDFVGVNVYQALGMGHIALLFAVMRKIVLEIPFLFLFNTLFPLYGLAYAQPAAEFLLAVGAMFMLRHIFRKCERQAHVRKISEGDM